MAEQIEVTTLAGGCFWCTEAVMQRLKGVLKVESGYANGLIPNPSYEMVCSGVSGYAEVVQVTFDASVISYADLLKVFITSHDPTSLNRQGADAGTQYRSGIYYHNESQKEVAEKVLAELAPVYSKPIVTELEPLHNYFSAEGYHQNYYNQNRYAGYCRAVIDPKVNKLRATYAQLLNKEALEED
ncbi:peptide-methionine (S)-S-oxide reductase [Pelobium manganitolerans]|uniref:Peptide methionine sulfoxide reductase MsrA n=1 Tax=Pelobium manganitolerans TaxID=1842495 RepID=A0A419S798_9SPHI|nr:peptide-methionine (S)-S-oxide reductase MsrA [Pelobium manganitolerans]RKD17194.1 peptide-methionine (S)-S-oxide reductase [Pelobium manganitolerans]